MEFLLAALKKTRRRLQVENLLLLLIRILVVVLLALALSQPVVKASHLSVLGQVDTHLIIVFDNSYSMDYKLGPSSPFETAKNKAYELINNLKPAQGDKASLVLLSSVPQVVFTEISVMDTIKKELANINPSDYGTNLFKTFSLVKELLTQSTNTRKVITIITDLQKTSWLLSASERNSFNQLLKELSASAEIKIINTGIPEAKNYGVARVYPSTQIFSLEEPVNFYAEVYNFSAQELTTLGVNFVVDGQPQGSTTLALTPYQSGSVSFTYQFDTPGPHWVQVTVEPDSLSIDNTRYFAVDVKESLKVLIVNGEPSPEPFKDEAVFLRYALNPTKNEMERISIYEVEVVTPLTFEDTNPEKYDLVIMANLEYLSTNRVKLLEEYVRDGGGLLIWLGDKVDSAFYNEYLYKNGNGLLPAELAEIIGDRSHEKSARLDKINFNHPVFSFFEQIKEILSRLVIYEYYKVSVDAERPDIKTLAYFRATNTTQSIEDLNPALIEKSLGRGKVILVTTSADTEWNLMPGRPPYLILLDQLALYLAGSVQVMKNVVVGAPLELLLNPENYAPDFTLSTPRQGMTSLSPLRVGEQNFTLLYKNTENVGLYSLTRSEEESETTRKTIMVSFFGVNTDPQEGDLRQIKTPEIRNLYPDFQFELVGESRGEKETGLTPPPRSNLWKYLAYAVLILLVLETILAQRFGSFKK